MTGNEVAALILAISGAIGTIFAGARNLRGDKFKREVDASASILGGLNQLVTTLQTELERVKVEHNDDRKFWMEERNVLKAQHAEEIADLNDRIDELSSQLYAIQHRSSTTRQRKTDKEL